MPSSLICLVSSKVLQPQQIYFTHSIQPINMTHSLSSVLIRNATRRSTSTAAVTKLLFIRNNHHPSQPSSLPPSQLTSTLVAMSNKSNEVEEQQQVESIFKQKKILRSKVRQVLKSMDPSFQSQEDDVIQNIVLEAPWFKSSKSLCAYVSCSALREVDTSKLLSQILCNPSTDGSMLQYAKTVYMPRIEDKNGNMRMFNITRIDDLVANSMNILEPAPVDADGNEREDVMHAKDPVDLFILPGLAFDRSGGRLGRSGGYYDTFLKKYKELAKEKNWKQPLLVALSYSLQIMDEAIPVTLNDVPVDAVVSPSGVIAISPDSKERM